MPQSEITRRGLLAIGGLSGAALLGRNVLAERTPKDAEPSALYLHWLRPTYYTGGELDPPVRLISALVTLSQDLDIAVGESSQTINGRVDAQGHTFVVKLKATYGSSTLFFAGEVELEKVFDFRAGLASGGVFTTRCVLSRMRDCDAFIEAEVAEYKQQATLMLLPAGRWTVEFSNGVTEKCEVQEDGAVSVVEERRMSLGKATAENGSVVIVYDDDRVERWTAVGLRMVVEHWFPGAAYSSTKPVLGIAHRPQ